MKMRSLLADLNEYEIRHLASHLLETREHATLHRLLELQESNGSNAWFAAKSRLGQTRAYLQDIAGAWRAVEENDRQSLAAGGLARGIALGIRYALIGATLADMAAQPAGMAVAFVKHGCLTAEEAVAQAFQIRDWSLRLETLTALVAITDGESRRACEKHALELIAEGPVNFVSRSSVGEEQGMAWSDHMLRAECLEALSGTLPDSLVLEAVAAGAQISNEFWRIHGLRKLVPRLRAEERHPLVADLYDMAKQTRLRFLRAEALAKVAPLFDEPKREARITDALLEAIDVLDDREARKVLELEPRSGCMTHFHDVQKQLQEEVRPLREIACHASEPQLRRGIARAVEMEGLPPNEALLVLLPLLAEKSAVFEAFQIAHSFYHPVYRNLIKAAITPWLARKDRNHVLQEALEELGGLSEPEIRSFCLSTMAVYLGGAERPRVLRQALSDVEGLEEESLRVDVLMLVAQALGDCAEGEKTALAQRAFTIAKGMGSRDQNSLLSTLIPSLAPSVIREEFRTVQRKAFGDAPRLLLEAWSNWADELRLVAPTLDAGLPAGALRDAIDGSDALEEHQRARLISLMALVADEKTLEAAIGAARLIENNYLKSSAFYALASHAPESQRAGLALETTEAIWAVHGGLKGAQPLLEAMIPITAADSKPALFDAWSRFLHSLTRDSLALFFSYLEPNRCAIEVLGGVSAIKEAALSVNVVERWWGGKTEATEKDSSSGQPDDRFALERMPTTAPAVVGAIIEVLVNSRQLERAGRLLAAFRSASNRFPQNKFYVSEASNSLLQGMANSAEFNAALRMLEEIIDPSSESLDLLVRQLISHDRLKDANWVFETIGIRCGEAASMSLAALLLESHLAEDRLSEALALFERCPALPKADGIESFVDMAFMLTNAFLKREDEQSAIRVAGALKADCEHAETIAGRLAGYAVALEGRDKPRAAFWRKLAEEIRGAAS